VSRTACDVPEVIQQFHLFFFVLPELFFIPFCLVDIDSDLAFELLILLLLFSKNRFKDGNPMRGSVSCSVSGLWTKWNRRRSGRAQIDWGSMESQCFP
jgi:hypothetical protein